MDSESPWAQNAQQFQQIFGDKISQVLQSLQQMGAGGAGAPGAAAAPLQIPAEKLQQVQQQYLEEAKALWNQSLQASTLAASDKRFSGDGWQSNPVAAFSAATYLLNARTLMELAKRLKGLEDENVRLKRLLADAMLDNAALKDPLGKKW